MAGKVGMLWGTYETASAQFKEYDRAIVSCLDIQGGPWRISAASTPVVAPLGIEISSGELIYRVNMPIDRT